MGINKIAKRLKNMKLITASYSITLYSFMANGYPIDFIARVVNNKLHYTIIEANAYSFYSYYDGSSFDDAFEMYVYIATKLNSVLLAEQINSIKNELQMKANSLMLSATRAKEIERNHLYYKKPLFLGINDPC